MKNIFVFEYAMNNVLVLFVCKFIIWSLAEAFVLNISVASIVKVCCCVVRGCESKSNPHEVSNKNMFVDVIRVSYIMKGNDS